MNILDLQTEVSLYALTLTHITEINNEFCAVTGMKPTKRFSTKPAAIKRTLENQELYRRELPAKPAKPAKAVKPANSFSMNVNGVKVNHDIATTTVKVLKGSDKEGSLLSVIIHAIDHSDTTVQAIIKNMTTVYSRPKSDKTVDQSFVIRKLKRFVQKGNLEFVTK